MTDPSTCRIVYRGISDEVAQRLDTENVITNTGYTDVTLRFWRACGPEGNNHDSCRSLMAINLPPDARMICNPDSGRVMLDKNLTLKCIGKAEFNRIQTPDGKTRDIHLYAMEMKR